VTTAVLIVLLWLAFAGSHVVLSGRTVRPRLVAALGHEPFLGIYSLIALATFIPLVWVFFADRHAGPLLWTTIGPPGVARWANYALMGAALALLVAGLLPSGTAPSAMTASGPAEPKGLIRITRHPMLAAFGLFGIAHLLVNGSAAAVAFFAGFPLFAWIGGRHQDARKVHEVPGYEALLSTTSITPFAAIVTGRQRLVVGELPIVGIVAGIAAAVVLRRYHGALFGP
jgi:uncharacterized membrane protein